MRNQYDFTFHWHGDPVPPALLLYRSHQQDSLRANWDGLVAGTDGSDDERSERMGAGYAMVDGPIPIRAFSAPVGGPLHPSDQKQLVSFKSCLMWQSSMTIVPLCSYKLTA